MLVPYAEEVSACYLHVGENARNLIICGLRASGGLPRRPHRPFIRGRGQETVFPTPIQNGWMEFQVVSIVLRGEYYVSNNSNIKKSCRSTRHGAKERKYITTGISQNYVGPGCTKRREIPWDPDTRGTNGSPQRGCVTPTLVPLRAWIRNLN